MALAEAASHQTGVLVTPPLHFGVSPYFLSYPGTISLKPTTYLHVVKDIIKSLYGYGFKRMLILNGHGGNTMAKTGLVSYASKHPDLQLRWYAWWLSPAVGDFAKEHGLETAHANWMENFSFTRIGEAPKEIKPRVNEVNINGACATRQAAGDGSYGGAYQVDDEIMDSLLNLCLDETLKLLRFE